MESFLPLMGEDEHKKHNEEEWMEKWMKKGIFAFNLNRAHLK